MFSRSFLALVTSVLLANAVTKEIEYQTCPLALAGLLSCHNTTAVENTCCFNAPGGLLVQTQFWDTLGPEDSWTIHGLWPDNCDGTYGADCDSSRANVDIRGVLQQFQKNELLDYMNKYWKGRNGDEKLWLHEWAKHGTCISTYQPRCYPDYKKNQEVVDYFQKVVDLFKTLDTHKALADAGITPDAYKLYDVADVNAAITKAFGEPAAIKCRGGNISEVWYHFHVKGTAHTGQYVPTKPVGPGAAYQLCRGRVRYLPKKKVAGPKSDGTSDYDLSGLFQEVPQI